MDIKKEREAFELNVSPITWERIEYNAENNIYMAKSKYWTSTIVQAVANEIDFGWKMWQLSKAQVSEGYVVVPMEPTEQILNRMTNAPIEVNHLCDNADIFLSEDEARIAYKAIIEALEPSHD